MTDDLHDWIPIAWWDETTKSVRIQNMYLYNLIDELVKNGLVKVVERK